jgi:hypothetical protein
MKLKASVSQPLYAACAHGPGLFTDRDLGANLGTRVEQVQDVEPTI